MSVQPGAPMRRRFGPVAVAALALLPFTARADAPKRPATAGSALYIANTADGSIVRCDGATGKVLNTLGANMNPVGLALGPDRNLYVTNYAEGRILRFDPATGKALGTFIPRGRGGMAEPITMAFGQDRNLYVATRAHNDIRRYNGRTGAFLGVFVPHGRGGLITPGDITFGPDGNLYVTNNSASDVLRFNGKTGAALGTFIKAGSGGLQDPQNIAFGPDGSLYVGSNGVYQYDRRGRFKRVFVAGEKLGNVGGLTFGPDGNLYVGDWQRNDIVRFNGKTGASLGVFVPPSSGLEANRYILFGPRGAGGTSPVQAAAARAARRRAMMAAEASRPALLAAGTPAPDFTVQDKDGKPVKLSDFRGKTVVLDFWSTWCGPCQASLPHTNEVAKAYKDKDVVVFAVNVWDTQPAFDKWLPEHANFDSLVFAIDPTKEHGRDVATMLYKVSGIPTQYVIGADGRIVKSFLGYGGPTDDLANAIKQAQAQ